ncbi:MAG: NADP-dependent phosphogluconate dehydrogenase [Phycisphaerae bacterium]|nr:NADP-dependent phosphogluconate dehydrogenase [Phycisphaerae bacterium]
MPVFPVPAANSADVGVVGLAVMGQNLALNIADHGFRVAVYNRSVEKTQQIVSENPPGVFGGTGGALVPADELRDFVRSIKAPRRIVIMVQAGPGTDAVIDGLAGLVDRGDVIVDGGNAEWQDTVRREKSLGEKGIHFVGSGVSGGETGARFGPSLMPGGKPEAWAILKPVWEAIAAKVDPASGKPLAGAAPGKPVSGGIPCTTHIGPDGAGHYVKMVHNGIEYGDMQLICEAYHVMRDVLAMTPADMSRVFVEWNKGDLDSFLVEITADVLAQLDPVSGRAFVDVVLDKAGQKGTGKWTIGSALDLGVPAQTMSEAVFARNISALKDERVAASKVLKGPVPVRAGPDGRNWIDAVRDALYCSKICSYAQGFALYSAASKASGWNLKLGEIAMIFRGGCIIRARFLQKIYEAYQKNPALPNLLLDPYFAGVIEKNQANWRAVVARAALDGIPVPAFGSALSYYDSYRSANLPANLLQAQRDYFGSHTYQRTDTDPSKVYHLDWTAPGRPQIEIRKP